MRLLFTTNATVGGPRTLTRATLAAVALLLSAFAITSPAQAAGGKYVYWTCHFPNGTATSVDGWSSENSVGNAGYVSSACGNGGAGGISATFNGGATSGTSVQWTYNPPAGTGIYHVDLRRTYSVPASNNDYSNATTGYVFNKNTNAYDSDHVIDQCQRFTGCTGNTSPDQVFDDPGYTDPPSTAIIFNVGCYGETGGTCGTDGAYRATANVSYGDIDLVDGVDPAVSASSFQGTAVSGQALSSNETLQYTASDVGAGIWQGQVSLDGTVVSPRATLNTNGGKCVPVNFIPNGGVNEFGSGVPCPGSASSGLLTLDTTKVANGPHILTVTVWDAAGNSASTSYGTKVTVNNPPATTTTTTTAPSGGPNGTSGDLATGHFTSKKKTRTAGVAYGKTLKLTGTLHDKKGKAIAGAVVDVLSGSATGPKIGSVTTNKRGTFTFKPGTVADSVVVFAYAPTVGGTFVDQRTVKIQVHAAVTIHASRSSVRRGTKVTFSGTVTAGALPATGARVEIKVLQNGRWVVGAVPSTNSAGKFKWTHTFRVPLHYGFRAQVLRTDGLLVSPGSSRIIHVTVR